MILKTAFLLIALVALNVQAKTRYDNYKLIRVKLENSEQVELVANLENNHDVDIWNLDSSAQKQADILLSPEAYAKYKPTLEYNKLNYQILNDNIQDSIDQEERELFLSSRKPKNNLLNSFLSYPQINDFIDGTVSANPKIASSYIAGTSTEGRLMKVIVLKSSTSTKSIWIDCGIHAREWVSHPTCIYTIQKLVDSYNADPSQSLLATFEIHILPMVNPDGYEYSRSTTRLWRKNRRIIPNSSCDGVDLNRNYDYQWLANGGASSDPCSETYAGSAPASEKETQNVVASINKKAGQWSAFFTIHSYGQYWLLSFGHTKDPADDYAEMKRVADVGASAIKAETSDKSDFSVGQSSVMLYINSGSSQDWAKGGAGIKYSYTLELRPRQGTIDAFIYGFTYPESKLENLTKETYAGLVAAIKALP